MNIRNQYRQINVQHNSGWYKEINLALKIIQALLAESGRHILWHMYKLSDNCGHSVVSIYSNKVDSRYSFIVNILYLATVHVAL